MIDVLMPQLGESVAEGTVTKWLVREGDLVKREQPLLEVATDKADTEIPSPADGVVTQIAVAEGTVVAKGGLLCRVDETASRGASAEAAAGTESAPAGGAGSSASAGGAGSSASAGGAGSGAEQQPSAGGAPQAQAEAQGQEAAQGEGGAGSAKPAGPAPTLSSPSARKLARETGVDLSRVPTNDKYGRVTRDDVMRAVSQSTSAERHHTERAPAPAAQPAMPVIPAASSTAELAQLIQTGGGFVPPIPGVGFGAYKVPAYAPKPGDEVIPFNRRRQITADHMVYSKVTSPHVVTVAEVDLHATSKLRDEHKDRFKKEGVPLTFLAFMCAATVKAIRENPHVNARVLDKSYVVLRDINLGVAVDTPGGLIVPSIKHADQLSLRGIASNIDDLATRARSGKITADDLANTTFTVSNPGLKGNLFGGAIISQPNVGILRMGEIKKRVVVVTKDGEDHIAIHPVMYVALSYDHRIIDGVLANSFLWRVADILSRGEFEV
jgi:2-oxoglutarate dehydrogenase E2 component (dihydrolipoamide succinyltransferase)